MPEGVRTSAGSVEEMAAKFEGWDPRWGSLPGSVMFGSLYRLEKIISCLKTALKWKLLHFKELDKWTKVGPAECQRLAPDMLTM
jgi:salicylate hydroxylase